MTSHTTITPIMHFKHKLLQDVRNHCQLNRPITKDKSIDNDKTTFKQFGFTIGSTRGWVLALIKTWLHR